jgi:hypothetical protein
MHWEKKIPNSKGLWASSSDGKTLGSVYIFKEDAWYNSDYYWCRIGDVPEISPKLEKLSIQELVECVQTGKSIYARDKYTNKFSLEKTIGSIKIFDDGSYLVDIGYKVTNNECDFYKAP